MSPNIGSKIRFDIGLCPTTPKTAKSAPVAISPWSLLNLRLRSVKLASQFRMLEAKLYDGVAQREGRQCTGRHALAIHGVECARCIAECDESGELGGPFVVATPPIGHRAMRVDFGDRFGALDRLGNQLQAQFGQHIHVARLVIGQLVLADSGNRDDPSIVLDREQHAGKRILADFRIYPRGLHRFSNSRRPRASSTCTCRLCGTPARSNAPSG